MHGPGRVERMNSASQHNIREMQSIIAAATIQGRPCLVRVSIYPNVFLLLFNFRTWWEDTACKCCCVSPSCSFLNSTLPGMCALYVCVVCVQNKWWWRVQFPYPIGRYEKWILKMWQRDNSVTSTAEVTKTKQNLKNGKNLSTCQDMTPTQQSNQHQLRRFTLNWKLQI